MRINSMMRLYDLIKGASEKGKTEPALCYFEKRWYGYGAEFTIQSLDSLIAEGVIIKQVRKGRYRTASSREKKQVARYYAV